MKTIDVILTNDEAQVRELVAKGYCPVECSINGRSIVDGLVMDHHEDRSGLEAVSVRALRDHAGARADDPRFVVVGACDADASFAIAALAGLIKQNKATMELAKTLAIMDTEPVGKNLSEMPYGGYLAIWGEDYCKGRINRTQEGALPAVEGWHRLTAALEDPDTALRKRLENVSTREKRTNEIAKQDLKRAKIVDGVCLINHSDVFGFNVWHDRNENFAATAAKGWRNPVVLIFNRISKSMGLACPNKEVAEELFGPGGLRNVFPRLGNWGGREQVGGSPRGKIMAFEDALIAQDKIVAVLKERRAETKPEFISPHIR